MDIKVDMALLSKLIDKVEERTLQPNDAIYGVSLLGAGEDAVLCTVCRKWLVDRSCEVSHSGTKGRIYWTNIELSMVIARLYMEEELTDEEQCLIDNLGANMDYWLDETWRQVFGQCDI